LSTACAERAKAANVIANSCFIYFSGNGGITGAGLPPKPEVTAGAASKDELPKLLADALLVVAGLDPNPDELNAGLGELLPKPPVVEGKLDVDD